MSKTIAANAPGPELLRLGAIREILRSPGPCVTIVLPPYRPGEPSGSLATFIKTDIQDATRQLAERQYPKSSSASLLQPIERLIENPALLAGSHWGRVIFRAPNILEQFHLTQPTQQSVTVAGSFAIRQLFSELCRPRVFYILALSKTRVDILRCAGLHAEAVKLPAGVPETRTDALALKPPDHDLENRSSAGRSTGDMRSVRFGTGSGRERQHAHLADFYKIVDRGIHELLREPATPLVLAGVDEETDSYRAVSAYRNLVKENIPGSPDASSQQTEMLQRAYSILRSDALQREAMALKEARERSTPQRLSTDLDTILRAAFEGRVAQLFVNERSERVDVLEQGAYRSWGKEDLLNLAAVQTIIHHGKACSLPSEMMPDAVAATAIMRF